MNPKQLLDTLQLQPKKSLGQNFLHDPGILDKIVQAAELSPQDTVLEVGPGTGALTVRLAQSGAQVIAVEVDDRLLPILSDQLRDFSNVRVVKEDILNADVSALVGGKPYSVVANLPYYITSAILRQLLETSHKPQRLVLTIQYEVAERLVAKPGDLSLLGVSVQFYGKPSIVARLNPAVFWPRPEVDSAIIRIDVYQQPRYEVPGEQEFFRVVRAGFSQKRKQLKNSLGSGLGLSNPVAAALITSAGIDPMRRAETLSLDEWAALTQVVAVKVK
ncbi:MAG: 16S rRNA (adenine(1518)-N(6)/adenine(1519)-N(6))-dimethyltransferase RsmA [Anaerolineae bacterium]|nr:16S rRNA (adenine(1518)-N(6)/adenine(1519)-N(6))-dimethyltransferase RsmA [Anaerolineae bacterium]